MTIPFLSLLALLAVAFGILGAHEVIEYREMRPFSRIYMVLCLSLFWILSGQFIWELVCFAFPFVAWLAARMWVGPIHSVRVWQYERRQERERRRLLAAEQAVRDAEIKAMRIPDGPRRVIGTFVPPTPPSKDEQQETVSRILRQLRD
jgi:hypothetical protein